MTKQTQDWFLSNNDFISRHKMFVLPYTEEQLDIIGEIRIGANILLSTAHATGKSTIFSNMADTYGGIYYSVGRSDYNLDETCRQHQNEDNLDKSKNTKLYLDNVLITDVNKFKQNLTRLKAHLRNIHIIAYFKNPENLERYFPKPHKLTKYFGLTEQLELQNRTEGDFKPLSDSLTGYCSFSINKIIKTDEQTWIYDRNDKIIDNHEPYNYKLEGKFPKQYFHGPSPSFGYHPTIIIRVNELDEPIDQRLLRATQTLIILKRAPPHLPPPLMIQQKLKEQETTGINLITDQNPHPENATYFYKEYLTHHPTHQPI